MGYPLPAQRRRRRRRLVWILVVAGIFLSLFALVVRFIAERRDLDNYLGTARRIAVTFESLGVRSDTIVAGLESADRPSLLEVLGETTTEATAAAAELAAQKVPDKAVVPGGFLAVAVEAWRSGIVGLEEGVRAVLDDPADPSGSLILNDAFLSLRVGDRAYAHFIEAVGAVDEEAVVRPYPAVEFIPVELNTRFDANLIAQRIQALEGLTAQHDIAVSDVRFDPAPAGEREGTMVIPFRAAITVEATITNRGNEPESDVAVNFRLIEGTVVVVAQQDRRLDKLEPGQSKTLTFGGLPVKGGEFYEVVVDVSLAIDDDPGSNRGSKVFYVNEEG